MAGLGFVSCSKSKSNVTSIGVSKMVVKRIHLEDMWLALQIKIMTVSVISFSYHHFKQCPRVLACSLQLKTKPIFWRH